MRRVVAAVTAAVVIMARSAAAQPTPGNAPGSQTGDGGGGYTGIATAPQANLFTGAAEASIPIETPPDRHGQSQSLALVYSSNGGPSAYGYGWALALPRISRSTKHGVPRFDETDQFVLAMPGGVLELEPVPGSARAYRPTVESTFPRIGFHEGQNYWKVVDKGGTAFTFGTAPGTRMGPGTTVDRTFAWLLERIEDPAGNIVEFFYRPDAGSGRSSGLPARIVYGSNPREETPHFVEIRLNWTARTFPSIPAVSYRCGFAEPLDVLLSSIETFAHGLPARRYDLSHEIDALTADAELIGVTLTAYAEDPLDDVRLPSTVFVYGDTFRPNWPTYDGVITEGLVVPDVGRLRRGKGTIFVDTMDINGDGIVDHLTMEDELYVRLGTGTGFAAPTTWNWPAPPRVPDGPMWIRRLDSDHDLETNLFDIDGDGFADVVDSRSNCGVPDGFWCVWRGSATGFADDVFPWPSPGTKLRRTARSQTRVSADLVDIDGDGRPDYVDTSLYDQNTAAYWRVFRNTGDGFDPVPRYFDAPMPFLSRAMDGALLYALFDMNADGLPDLVSTFGESPAALIEWEWTPAWLVYYNTGEGIADTPVPWYVDGDAKLPSFLSLAEDQNGTRIDLLDVNGDGRPDLVRPTALSEINAGDGHRCGPISCYPTFEVSTSVAPGYCCQAMRVFLNTGSSFASPVTSRYPSGALRGSSDSCPLANPSGCTGQWLLQYDLFDFNGDGLVDLVTQGGPGDDFETWRVFLHPATPSPTAQPGSTRTRPHLLVAMLNGIGGQTLLSYAPAAVAPDSVLPFPFWTVNARQMRDTIYDAAPVHTSLSYRGGRYDRFDRELRGFAMVWEVDGAGRTTVREFEQDDRLKGRLRRLSLLAQPTCQALDPQDPDDPCTPWRFIVGSDDYDWSDDGAVLLEAETRRSYSNASEVEALQTRTHYEYDDLGNETRRTVETPLAATTEVRTEYERRVTDKAGGMPDVYFVNKPKHVWMFEDGRPSPLLERTFDYDWRSPARGVLSSTSTCIAWDGENCSGWSTRRFEYDGYGNVIAATSATGVSTTTTYDAAGQYAVRAEDADGAVTESAYDRRTGKVTWTRAPNGVELYARFDGLGRVLSTWGPGTSREDPLGTNEYVPGAGSEEGALPRLTAQRKGTAPISTFFDGLGREVGRKTLAEAEGRRRGVITGLKRYDERGLVQHEAVTFEVAGLDVRRLTQDIDDAPAWLSFQYDGAARRTGTTFPDASTIRTDRQTPGILVSYDANTLDGQRPGAVTVELFDGLGRRLQRDTCSRAPTTEQPYDCPNGALERSESWFYDGLGRVIESRVSALGRAAGDAVTTTSYDGLGNRTGVSNGNSGTWRFTHDADGRLITVLPPDGRGVYSRYDRGGRLQRRTSTGTRTSYRYYRSGGGYGKVRRISTRTPSMRLQHGFEYDDRGRLTQESWQVYVSGDQPKRWLTVYTYDELDRVVAVEHPLDGVAGAPVTTTFNQFGQPVALASDDQEFVKDAVYDIHGRLRQVDYGNGLSDRYEYDPWRNATQSNGRLRCLRTTSRAADGSACDTEPDDLEALWYRDYDANGSLLHVEDRAHSPTEVIYDTRSYAYDALGRLSTAQYGDGSAESFDFDPLDNLLRNGDTRLTFADAVAPNQITSGTGPDGPFDVDYDTNGNRRRMGDTRYRYDSSQRLTEVLSDTGLIAEYGYEDTGARIYRYDGLGETFRYEFGGGVALEDETLERSISFGGKTVAVMRSALRATPGDSETIFLHSDHQGTPRLVTDGRGRVVERSRHSAFGRRLGLFDGQGRPRADSVQPWSFTGQFDEAGAELVYFGARYYDPVTGSFLSLDPEFQFTSPYAYSDGNPVLGRDADGRVWELTAVEIVAILVGTGTFIDTLAATGNPVQSLSAGVMAGVNVLVTNQLTTAMIRPAPAGSNLWLQKATAVATQGFQIGQAMQAVEDGRYASGIIAAGLTAASLIGIETANDPGPGETDAERYDRHGIVQQGKINGIPRVQVNGVEATRPGLFHNLFVALRENLRILVTRHAACVGGCEEVAKVASAHLKESGAVDLRCNSYGAIKCLRAIEDMIRSPEEYGITKGHLEGLSAELTGAPILRPPVIDYVTYHANLFDPVVWVGTAYSIPFRSDVMLGRSWWVPGPLLVHHPALYNNSVFDLVSGNSQ